MESYSNNLSHINTKEAMINNVIVMKNAGKRDEKTKQIISPPYPLMKMSNVLLSRSSSGQGIE